ERSPGAAAARDPHRVPRLGAAPVDPLRVGRRATCGHGRRQLRPHRDRLSSLGPATGGVAWRPMHRGPRRPQGADGARHPRPLPGSGRHLRADPPRRQRCAGAAADRRGAFRDHRGRGPRGQAGRVRRSSLGGPLRHVGAGRVAGLGVRPRGRLRGARGARLPRLTGVRLVRAAGAALRRVGL
ncbi:MAG: hypothetical protein AVDCRST_MAG04-2006, partial [uncultured Acetobacteraceae bacterium]